MGKLQEPSWKSFSMGKRRAPTFICDVMLYPYLASYHVFADLASTARSTCITESTQQNTSWAYNSLTICWRKSWRTPCILVVLIHLSIPELQQTKNTVTDIRFRANTAWGGGTRTLRPFKPTPSQGCSMHLTVSANASLEVSSGPSRITSSCTCTQAENADHVDSLNPNPPPKTLDGQELLPSTQQLMHFLKTKDLTILFLS